MSKKILIIRFRRIGDAVLTTAVINSIKKTIPDSEIHYVLNEGIANLFEHHPHIDKIITFSKKDLSSLPRYIKKIWQLMRNEKYDIIIDHRSTTKTLFFPLFSLASKYRIGVSKAYNRIINNYRVNIFTKRDYIEQQLTLIDPLNKEYKVEKDTSFDISIPESHILKFRKKMEDEGIDFNKPVLVCSVVTRVESKQWRVDRMKEVLHLILNKYKDVQIIFNYGDKVEKESATSIYKDMGCPKQIFINIEADSLTDLAAMLSNSNYLFGNEGGTRHISQALSIPSYAIYSPGNSIYNWLPNRCEKYDGISSEEIPEPISQNGLSRQEKFDTITVDLVWKQLEPKLDKYLYQ